MPDMAEATITEDGRRDPSYREVALNMQRGPELEVTAYALERWTNDVLALTAGMSSKAVLDLIVNALTDNSEYVVQFMLETVINDASLR